MRELRVHAAIARKPQQMQAVRARVAHAIEQHGVSEKFSRRDHHVDARYIHLDDPPGADVQVPHFAIAHLARWKTDEGPGSMDQRIREIPQEFVVGRLASGRNCVAFEQCIRAATGLDVQEPVSPEQVMSDQRGRRAIAG